MIEERVEKHKYEEEKCYGYTVVVDRASGTLAVVVHYCVFVVEWEWHGMEWAAVLGVGSDIVENEFEGQ